MVRPLVRVSPAIPVAIPFSTRAFQSHCERSVAISLAWPARMEWAFWRSRDCHVATLLATTDAFEKALLLDHPVWTPAGP